MNRQTSVCKRSIHSMGFTLIELMITVLIVAILTTIAYPSYRSYVIRGQLVDATQGLSAMRANMERYFQDNRTYQTNGTSISPCTSPPAAGRFDLSCTTLGPTTYTLQALGHTGTLSGFAFSVDQANTQSTVITSPPAPSGWSSCTTAWVTRAGGC